MNIIDNAQGAHVLDYRGCSLRYGLCCGWSDQNLPGFMHRQFDRSPQAVIESYTQAMLEGDVSGVTNC